MINKILNMVSLIGLSIIVWFLNLKYENVDLDKLFYTFIAISISYFIFKVGLEGALGAKIRGAKVRYSFRKTTQLLFIVVSMVIILRVWVENPQALLVSYGLIAAGVAIALQDVFKNFAGSIVIFIGNTYGIGDRIEIDGKHGDVIDIGVFYTTLIEIRGWVDGDQTTGRLIMIPNGKVLSNPINNYTKDHSFIWDELSLPITHDSPWRVAVEIIEGVVKNKTAEETKNAEREISQLAEKYYLSKRNIEPRVFITPTDNWIMLRVRYVVKVHDRRLVRNEIYKLILGEIEKNPSIRIASETLTLSTED